jgi:hypothetical protein
MSVPSPDIGVPHESNQPGWREALSVLLILLTFVCLGLALFAHRGAPWQDEVQHADPAVSLLYSEGLTSGAYSTLAKGRYFINSPLYPWSLSAWMTVFGFSVETVRSFNYLLTALIAGTLWLAVARWQIIVVPRLRALLVVLLVCSTAFGEVYRNNRYDSAGMLILAAAFLALSFKNSAVRLPVLFICAALVPLAGLQLVPFTGMMGVAALLFLGRSCYRELLIVGLGLGTGGLLLYGSWWLHGAGIRDFLASAADLDVVYLGGHWGLFRTFLSDRSADVLMIWLLLVLLWRKTRRETVIRSTPMIGLLFAVAIPCGMQIAGRYQHMYVWMGFVPLAICAVRTIQEERHVAAWPRVAHVLAVGAACLIGLPLSVGNLLLTIDEPGYGAVEQFVSAHVRPGDRVYCSYAAYYPAKQSTREVWSGLGLFGMTPQQSQSVTLAILNPAGLTGEASLQRDGAERLLDKLGGKWKLEDQLRVPCGWLRKTLHRGAAAPFACQLDVYRRVGP